MCKIKHLKPNYINIKVNGKKSQDKNTRSYFNVNFNVNFNIVFNTTH